MDTAVWVQIVSTIGIITVACLQLRAEKERKRQNTEEEKYKKEKEQQSKDNLSLQIAQGKLICTSGDLALTTSRAVAGQKTNGDIKEAQRAYLESRAKFYEEEAAMAHKYLKKLEQ